MPRCSFCRREYSVHKGVTLFTNMGQILNFCSSKCRKNYNLGRDNKRVRWVKKFKKKKGEKKE